MHKCRFVDTYNQLILKFFKRNQITKTYAFKLHKVLRIQHKLRESVQEFEIESKKERENCIAKLNAAFIRIRFLASFHKCDTDVSIINTYLHETGEQVNGKCFAHDICVAHAFYSQCCTISIFFRSVVYTHDVCMNYFCFCCCCWFVVFFFLLSACP